MLVNFSNLYEGVKIYPLISLPYPEFVKACCLETKKEINVPTGVMIHFVKIQGRHYASNELIEKLKQI